MQPTMTAQLVTDALMMALWRRGKPSELLHHSDQGSQYTSEEFQRLLTDQDIECSMSKKGRLLGQRCDRELLLFWDFVPATFLKLIGRVLSIDLRPPHSAGTVKQMLLFNGARRVLLSGEYRSTRSDSLEIEYAGESDSSNQVGTLMIYADSKELSDQITSTLSAVCSN